MLRYLLDTDFCIHVMRDKPAAARVRFVAELGNMAVSTVTIFELQRGALRSDRRAEGERKIEAFVSQLEVISLNHDDAIHAADIRVTLERAGMVIGSYDLLIAGQARSRALTVITGNIREFSRVDGLRCADWLKEGPL